MQVLRIPAGYEVPEGYQSDWTKGRWRDLPGVPVDAIVRIPEGAPWPAGARHASEPPVVTDAHREAARQELARLLESRDPLTRELAEADLEDLERTVWHARGMPHPYAYHAPPSIGSTQEACEAHVDAMGRWSSRCSSAVIRAAVPSGYDVWVGVGGMMGSRQAHAETLQEAEQLAWRAVRQERLDSGLAEALDEWAPDTPVFTSTLAAFVDELPVQIRRGPCSSAQLARGSVDGLPVGGSSWDLPVVAVYRGDGAVLERHDERVTWDDEEARAEQRERQRMGERRRAAEIAWCMARLQRHPALAPLCGRRELQRAEVVLGNGDRVRTVGPVRARHDGAEALALIEMDSVRGHPSGRRVWMALGQFVA
ncbi:MAG: hypothetical protein ACOCUS_02505 [Polyangiales bacterium]